MGMLISCPTSPGIEMNTCTYMHAHTHIHTYVNSQLTCVLSHLNLISTSLWSLSNTVWLAPNSEGSNQSMLLFSGNCNFMCVVSLTSHMGITGSSIYILMRIWGFLEKKNHWLETLQLKYSMTSSTDVSAAAFCIFNRRLLIVSHLDVLSQEPLLLSISPSFILGKCLETESIYVNMKVLDSPYK